MAGATKTHIIGVARRERQSPPDADLAQEPEVVGDRPVLSDPPVVEPAYCDPGQRHAPAAVRSIQDPARDDLFAVGNLVDHVDP